MYFNNSGGLIVVYRYLEVFALIARLFKVVGCLTLQYTTMGFHSYRRSRTILTHYLGGQYAVWDEAIAY